MAEELDRELIKRISEFSQEKGYPIKKASTTVSSAINELLSIAKKKGRDSGKKNVDDFLKELLKEANNLCDNKQFDKIGTMAESAEVLIQKGVQ